MSRHQRDLYMFIAACLTIILVALIGAATEAKSHEWYEWECCSDEDCAPYDEVNVRVTPTGYRLHDGVVLGFHDKRVRPSRDWRYHRCDLGGQLQCLYVPPGSM